MGRPSKGQQHASLCDTDPPHTHRPHTLTDREPTGCAGAPATISQSATALSTRLPGAMRAPLPMCMLPRTLAAAPIRTLSPTFGCLSPVSLPVPPSVTSCVWIGHVGDERVSSSSSRKKCAGCRQLETHRQLGASWGIRSRSVITSHGCEPVRMMMQCRGHASEALNTWGPALL